MFLKLLILWFAIIMTLIALGGAAVLGILFLDVIQSRRRRNDSIVPVRKLKK